MPKPTTNPSVRAHWTKDQDQATLSSPAAAVQPNRKSISATPGRYAALDPGEQWPSLGAHSTTAQPDTTSVTTHSTLPVSSDTTTATAGVDSSSVATVADSPTAPPATSTPARPPGQPTASGDAHPPSAAVHHAPASVEQPTPLVDLSGDTEMTATDLASRLSAARAMEWETITDGAAAQRAKRKTAEQGTAESDGRRSGKEEKLHRKRNKDYRKEAELPPLPEINAPSDDAPAARTATATATTPAPDPGQPPVTATQHTADTQPAATHRQRPTAEPAQRPAASQLQPGHSPSSSSSGGGGRGESSTGGGNSDSGGKAAKKRRAVPPSTALLQRCGVTTASDTSIVLTLTPKEPRQEGGKPTWSSMPRMADSDTRSMVATARLLDRLSVVPPRLPLLYSQCDSIAELAEALRQRTATKPTTLRPDWTERLAAAEQEPLERRAATLHSLAADILASKLDPATPCAWANLLTTASGCMSRPRDTKGSDPTARQSVDPDRCLLRLDFITPLSSLCIQHHLRALDNPATAQPQQAETAAGGRQPRVRLDVQPYNRRLVQALVTGFAVGPIHPGRDNRCTSYTELHGNWQLLQDFLALNAPHCTADPKPLVLNSGVGAVQFVLEQTHLSELLGLDKLSDPEYGITRPLKLHVKEQHLSNDVACSSCGEAGHQARDCTKQTLRGARTCKHCYATDHTSQECAVPKDRRKCGLCGKDGHSTHGCTRYRPQWVDIVVKHPAKERQPSFRDAFVASRRGWSLSATQAQGRASPPQQPDSTAPGSAGDQSIIHRRPGEKSAWGGGLGPQGQQPIQQQSTPSLEQALTTLTLQVAEMQKDALAFQQRMFEILVQLLANGRPSAPWPLQPQQHPHHCTHCQAPWAAQGTNNVLPPPSQQPPHPAHTSAAPASATPAHAPPHPTPAPTSTRAPTPASAPTSTPARSSTLDPVADPQGSSMDMAADAAPLAAPGTGKDGQDHSHARFENHWQTHAPSSGNLVGTINGSSVTFAMPPVAVGAHQAQTGPAHPQPPPAYSGLPAPLQSSSNGQ